MTGEAASMRALCSKAATIEATITSSKEAVGFRSICTYLHTEQKRTRSSYTPIKVTNWYTGCRWLEPFLQGPKGKFTAALR